MFNINCRTSPQDKGVDFKQSVKSSVILNFSCFYEGGILKFDYHLKQKGCICFS